VPYLLDTDHLSIVLWGEEPASSRLVPRLEAIPPDDLATSIVSFQEQVQGWQAYLNRAKKPAQIVTAYARLEIMWRSFLKMTVLSFGEEAQSIFTSLRSVTRGIETMDARIAAIALSTGSVLLTRNTRHFRKVPGLLIEDWTGN